MVTPRFILNAYVINLLLSIYFVLALPEWTDAQDEGIDSVVHPLPTSIFPGSNVKVGPISPIDNTNFSPELPMGTIKNSPTSIIDRVTRTVVRPMPTPIFPGTDVKVGPALPIDTIKSGSINAIDRVARMLLRPTPNIPVRNTEVGPLTPIDSTNVKPMTPNGTPISNVIDRVARQMDPVAVATTSEHSSSMGCPVYDACAIGNRKLEAITTILDFDWANAPNVLTPALCSSDFTAYRRCDVTSCGSSVDKEVRATFGLAQFANKMLNFSCYHVADFAAGTSCWSQTFKKGMVQCATTHPVPVYQTTPLDVDQLSDLVSCLLTVPERISTCQPSDIDFASIFVWYLDQVFYEIYNN